MKWNRREWLGFLSWPAAHAWAQGVARRAATPAPRGKPSGIPFPCQFTDIAKQAGLTEPTVYGGTEAKQYIVETVGCGVAFFDYDQDGWLDIFVLSGSLLEGDPAGVSNRLYHNNRDGTFTDVTAKAGLVHSGWASAVCIGDYDGDGIDDLFVTYRGQNVLYRNNGNGTFSDVTRQAGLLHPKSRWSSGCTFLETNRNGLLDLVVATYLDFDQAKVPKPGESANCNWKGVPVNCGPRGLPPGRLYYYRNNGDGTFTDQTEQTGLAKAVGSYCMTAVAADFTGDGWTDLYVACDSTPSFLFKNNRDGSFADVSLESGVALNEDGMEQAGMGVGVGDFNLDGHLDIFKTHFADDTDILYQNDGTGSFEDITIRSGLAVETRYIRWGAGIVDLDNDGLPDVFLVSGSVYPELERKLPSYPFKTPRLIFRNLGNSRFEELIQEAGSGIAAPHASRGCAFGDFDNDGDMDVVVVNLNEPPSLLRNDLSGSGHWLKVKLVGTKSNRTAIGARVIARYGKRMQAQAVMSQSSFYSASDLRLHFGLGPVDSASLEIRWPSGAVERIPGVASGQLVTVREGQGIVKAERFPRTKAG